MTVFLYSATGADGRSAPGRIDAASLDAARFRLEEDGLREIVFHTDELNAQLRKAHGMQSSPSTPEQELRARQSSSGGLAFIGRVYAGNWIVWAPITALAAYFAWKGAPFSSRALGSFVLAPIGLLFPLWAAVPARSYNHLLEASAWARWGEVRRRCAGLRRWGHLFQGKVPALEVDVREAMAMAALGDLSGALASLKKYETALQPASVFPGRLASVHGAGKDWAGMARCQEQAWELSDHGTPQAIDYATTLIWRLRDADGAQRVLDSVAGKQRAAMAQAFTSYAEGLIAIERAQPELAQEKLQSALAIVRTHQSPLTELMADFIQAHLAIAVARGGDKAQARQLLRASLPRLTAHKDLELAKRCAAAVA